MSLDYAYLRFIVLYPIVARYLKRHEFMAELIPYATLEVIEQAGYLPTLEAADTVTDALRRWMKQPLVLRH